MVKLWKGKTEDVSVCCNAYLTYHGGTLVCRKCHEALDLLEDVRQRPVDPFDLPEDAS